MERSLPLNRERPFQVSAKFFRSNVFGTRVLKLARLSTDIVESILAGTEPAGLTLAKLTEQPIPEDWNEQRRLYGFPEQ